MTNKVGKGTIAGVVLATIILTVVIMAVNPGGIIPANFGSGPQTPENPFGDINPTGTTYQGLVDLDANGFDALEIATVYDDEDFTASYFRKVPGGYQPLGTAVDIAANTPPARATVSITPEDKKLYMTIDPQDGGSSDLLYPAAKLMNQQNSKILSFDFFNIDDDSDREFVFEIDVTNLGDVGRVGVDRPGIVNTILMYDDVTTATVTTGGIVQSIGTGLQTARLDFTEVFSEDASVNPEAEYQLTFNMTDMSEINLATSYLDIPNIGKKFLSEFSEQLGSSTTVYKYIYATDIGGSNFVTVPSDGDLSVDIQLVLKTNFDGANDGIQATLQVKSFTPSQGTSTSSDCTKVTVTTGTNC